METVRSALEEAANPQTEYVLWRNEIDYAIKELEGWHKDGAKAIQRYSNKKNAWNESRVALFNLFASNVDVLSAALYATPPKVSVKRVFSDYDDDLARVASLVMERCLSQDVESLDSVLSQAVQDRLITGMGTAWARIELEESGEGLVTGQQVVFDHVHWTDLLWSPCRTWEDRRWVARRVYMDYDAGCRRFGELFKAVPMGSTPGSTDTESTADKNRLIQEAAVYEIWDRQAKQVLWLADGLPRLLDKKGDFLGISGFEPTPKPFFGTVTTSNCVPIPDYTRWIDQYRELDVVNQRVSMLTKACKVAGVYDRAQDGVKSLLSDAVDNTLVPVDNWAMFAEVGGLKGTIDWMPLDTVIQAQNQLRAAREDVKQQLYELTGLSDIIRGASDPNETLGAQQLKANFGSSRIQQLRKQLECFVTDLMQIKGEIIGKHFPVEALLAKSNIMNTGDAPYALQAIESLRSDSFREYRIVAEPYSMAQIDYAQEKQDKLEFLEAIGVFMERSLQMMQVEPALSGLMATFLKFGVSGFKVSRTLESEIDKNIEMLLEKQRAQEGQPPPPDPAQMQMEAQAQQAQVEAQLEMQKLQAEVHIQQQKADLEREKMQFELLAAKQAHALEMQKMQAEIQLSAMKAQHETEMNRMDMASNLATAQINARDEGSFNDL